MQSFSLDLHLASQNWSDAQSNGAFPRVHKTRYMCDIHSADTV